MKIFKSFFLFVVFGYSCQTMEPPTKDTRRPRNPYQVRIQNETQSDISYYKDRSPGAARLRPRGVLNRGDALMAVDGKSLRETNERRKSGSLWTEGSRSNFLFVADDSKKIGDIIYIDLKEDLQAMLRRQNKRGGRPVTRARAPRRQPAARRRGPKAVSNDPQANQALNQNKQQPAANKPPAPRPKRPVRQPRRNTLIAARVIDKLENGVLLVEGHKLVDVNKTIRQILVSGYINEADINNNNEVDSRKMADLTIDYVVARK